MEQAGIETWPKLFHNLLASCATELAQEFPDYIAVAWISGGYNVGIIVFVNFVDCQPHRIYGRFIIDELLRAVATDGARIEVSLFR